MSQPKPKLDTDQIWNLFDQMTAGIEAELSEDETDQMDPKDPTHPTHPKVDPDAYLCYHCKSENLAYDEETIVCRDCGYENGQVIDFNQEWRFYGNDDNKHTGDPSRCGAPINPLLPESSMSTCIGGRGFSEYKRINQWNSMPYKERNLLKIYKNIQNISQANNLSDPITNRAQVMYKIISDNHEKKGKSNQELAIGCIYYSSKDKNNLMSLKELSQISGMKVKKVIKGCKQFEEMMYVSDKSYVTALEPITPEDYINKFAKILQFSPEHNQMCIDVWRKMEELGLLNENVPASIAATCIYIVSEDQKLNISKKLIKEKCSISDVTVSKSYKKVSKFLPYILEKKTE